MKKITKSLLMLLFTLVGVVSAQAQDAPAKDKWFTDNVFCYKCQDGVLDVSRSMELPWAADPENDTNGCIKLSVAASATQDHSLQFMIRGAKYDGADLMNGAFEEGAGFKVTFKVKADGEYSDCPFGTFYSLVASGKDGWKFSKYPGEKLNVTTEWQTVSFTYLATADDAGKFTAVGFNLANPGSARTFYFDDVKIVRLPLAEKDAWFDASKFTAKDYEDFTEVVSDQQWSPGSWQPAPQYYNDKTTVKMVKTQPDVATVRFVEQEDGSYIEVKSNDMPVSDYDCQFFMEIPEDLRANGTKVEVSMKAWVDAENGGDITVQPQIHAAPAAWKDNSNPKATFVAGKWTDIKYCFTINKDDVQNYCFNLSDAGTEKARTYRFKDITFLPAKADWYYANEFHAKDYKKENPEDPDPVYADGENPHPLARYVYDAEGGYVEVVTNAKANQTYNSQLWIAIPEQYVGTSSKLTMEVQASKAIKCPESFQATATGNGWGCNPGPGSGVEFKDGEWTTVERILKTKDVKSTGTWKDRQADQYCLDLSEVVSEGEGNDKVYLGEAITYQFRNVKFEAAAEPWYMDNSITVDGEDAPYIYGTGEAGGYVEVAGGKQIVFGIPENLQGGDVKISMNVKAAAADATTDISYTTEWAAAEVIVEAAEATYALALPAEGTFDFDEVAFERYFKPVDYGDLVEIAVEGTLVKEIDFTTATSYTHSPGWASIPAGYSKKLIQGEGLEIVNEVVQESAHAPQFFILENVPVVKGKDYAVRYTMKYTGEGGQMQINLTDANWGGNIQALYDLAAGPIYTQMVHYANNWVTDGNANVFFQSGLIKGRLIVEKVEVFDVTPKYDEMDWSDNDLVVNGNLEGEDMSSFAAKITTEDETDPETLPAVADDLGKYAASSAALWPEEATVPEGAKGININTEAVGDEGKASDTQLIVRLNKVIPAGTLYKVEFDLMSTSLAEISTEIDADPGVKLSADGIAKGASGSTPVKVEAAGKYVHYLNYCKAPEGGMRSIVFNLAGEKKAKFWFDNFSVKVLNDEGVAADIATATETADATSMWAETLALNVAVNNGKNTDTEEYDYTEASVTAFEDAVAAGKAELKNAEATKQSLVAAKQAIDDAVLLLPAPETDPDFADFELIPLAQEDQEGGGVVISTMEEKDGYTEITTKGGIDVLFKMKNVDVSDCDYIVVKLATPAPDGLSWSVWTNNASQKLDEGDTEIKYVFDDEDSYDHACEIKDGIIPEISSIGIWDPAGIKLRVYGVYKHKVPVELSYTDLTADMFFQWDELDASAKAQASAKTDCAYFVNEESDMPYGNGSVAEHLYADLSEYATLEVTTAPGETLRPRFLFNRDVANGQDNEVESESHLIDMPKFAWSEKYQSVKENEDGSKTYIIDIAAIVAEKGFAHLNSIKGTGGSWGQKYTVTAMKLGYVGEAPEIPVPVAIEGVEVEGETLADGKYIENGQIVIVKGGKKYTVAGVEIK